MSDLDDDPAAPPQPLDASPDLSVVRSSTTLRIDRSLTMSPSSSEGNAEQLSLQLEEAAKRVDGSAVLIAKSKNAPLAADPLARRRNDAGATPTRRRDDVGTAPAQCGGAVIIRVGCWRGIRGVRSLEDEGLGVWSVFWATLEG